MKSLVFAVKLINYTVFHNNLESTTRKCSLLVISRYFTHVHSLYDPSVGIETGQHCPVKSLVCSKPPTELHIVLKLLTERWMLDFMRFC